MDSNPNEIEDAGEYEENGTGNNAMVGASLEMVEPEGKRSYATCRLLIWAFVCIAIFVVVIALRKNAPPTSSGSSSSSQSIAPHLSRRHKNPDIKSNDIPCEACKETAKEMLSYLSKSVHACDDFYNFACQGWEKGNPIPDHWEWTTWSPIIKLHQKSNHMVVEILNERIDVATDIPALIQAKKYYRNCLSSYKLEEHGVFQEKKTMKIMLDTLEEYGGWPILFKKGTWNSSRFDMLKSIAALRRKFDTPEIFNIYVNQSPPEYLMTNRILLLPSSNPYILSEKPGSEGFKNMMAYKDFIVNTSKELLRFKGITEIDEIYLEKQAFDIIRVYIELQTAAEKPNNKKALGFSNNEHTTFGKLQSLLDQHVKHPFKNQMDLLKLFNLLFANTDIKINKLEPIGVGNVDYLLGVTMLLSHSDQEAIANYLHLQIYFDLLLLLPSLKLRSYNERRQISLGRRRQSTSSHHYHCAGQVEQIFTFALGSKFVEKRVKSSPQAFPLGKAIEQVGHLFTTIRLAFSQLMSSSNQIENKNKHKLRVYLFGSQACIGHPSWILDKNRVQKEYADLDLRSANYFEQTLFLNEWKTIKKLKKLQEQAEETCDWTQFPGSLYIYIFNELIYVPTGALNVPLFHLNFPKSIIFGILGSILGHELGHSVYQNIGDGWITVEGGHETKLSNCLVEYYSNFTYDELINEGVHLDGRSTLGENFADETGVQAAYSAFKVNKYFKGGTLEGFENYTDEQLFFIAFAQYQCESKDLNSKRSSLIGATHSPSRFRVLGPLMNFPEFAKVWKCPVGSKMNPKPTNMPETCKVF